MPSQLETDLVFMHLLIHSVLRWLTRGNRTYRLQYISGIFHREGDIGVLVTKILIAFSILLCGSTFCLYRTML
jgi:hypothetical protein